MDAKKKELGARFADYQKNECHNNVAETRWWCEHYKELCGELVGASLVQPAHGEVKAWNHHFVYEDGEKDEVLSHSQTVPAIMGAEYAGLSDALYTQPPADTIAVPPSIGDYVLATKYSDGDPGDPWALGSYAGEENGRHFVNDSAGNTIRAGGYRRVGRVRKDVGHWLLNVAAKQLEQSPPGTVNLWAMLTDAAKSTGEGV